MTDIFLEFIKRVGIFVIIGQTILHFGIGKKYEKYMKLIISFMVAAQIVSAFGAYLKKEQTALREWGAEDVYENWNRNMKVLEEEFQEKQTELSRNLQKRLEKKETEQAKEEENYGGIKIEKIVIK